jgi:hypothetical protein
MGLLDKLTQQGSNLTAFNGATPTINPLATQQSEMHYEYSLNGKNAGLVNSQYQQYLDGVANILPSPSTLDLQGLTPSKYTDNLPG